MSGRIRSIKPELIEDAVTAGLTDVAFRLFIGCILLADDYGNLRFEAAWLKGQVYWARDVDPKAFADALEELGEKLVDAYVVKGQRYAAIRNWAKHQKVSHPGKPRVPGPPRPSGESPETLRPDLRSPISDPDPEGDLPRAREGVADAPGDETPDEPPRMVTDLPTDGPPPLDAAIPPAWLERAHAIVKRTDAVDVVVETVWRKYVAWLNERDFEQSASEARWVRWVEDECSAAIQARGRAYRREWAGPRLVGGTEGHAPYHSPSRLAAPDYEPEAPVAPRKPLPRPVHDEAARETAKRLAAGVFR